MNVAHNHMRNSRSNPAAVDNDIDRRRKENGMSNQTPNAAGREVGLDIGRRELLKLTGAGVAAFGAASIFNSSHARAQNMSDEWDKVFPRSENVDHEKVTFKNRYGITLAGDLYLPKDRADSRLPALAVSGPFGAVKEQSSGLYAQTMAERGFVTLAFDPSYTGGKRRRAPQCRLARHQFRRLQCRRGFSWPAAKRRPQPHRRHRDLWLQRHGADGRHQRFPHQSGSHGFHV